MDLLCAVKLACRSIDHRGEAEAASSRYPSERILKRILEIPSESARFLLQLRNNGVKASVYGFLSGSLILDCSKGEGICLSAAQLVKADMAANIDGYIYIPYTVLREQIVDHLPVEVEEQQIKRPYIVGLPDVESAGDVVESLAMYLTSASYFFGGKIEKVITKITYIPQLINKYNTQIDILVKFFDKTILGIHYVDIRRTVHMGFSAIEDYMKYGLDYVILLHPYVDHKIHRRVVNRMGELEISSAGYIVFDDVNGVIYIYRFPRYNQFLSKYIYTHSYSMSIRSYIESL
ncbi:hypothetical protein [Thermoproteus tenax]|uniref:Uncharacterized protein n=1 Tax=Thermoproteus tenax (strain ATCC 35583 / DSM 2078 / JCM 9277 / NBRC 100435 / Kra 1) TaxID=768679 RepID=G4RL68_THETK|nr:hypothetical protein [Thermoproteus tenax]CCC82313.1 conserved hypothetical protein [Thermoproteus tenax Kra 1]